jgi:hypothetical protein
VDKLILELEPILEPEPINEAGAEISSQSQPQTYSSMSSFSYDPDFQASFDTYMAPPQASSMQDYFGYLVQFVYYLNLNQQTFQQWVNDEFTNFQ